MEKVRHRLKLIATILGVIALQAIAGFGRDGFFVQLNNILYMKFYPNADQIPIHPALQVFAKLDYNTLYYLKFPFTLIWTLLYFLLNAFTVKRFDARPSLQISLRWCYLLLLAMAILSAAYGYLMHGSLEKDEYALSRWLMGIAQSPLPALVWLASAKLFPVRDASGSS